VLVISDRLQGLSMGNQQFTVRNVTFDSAVGAAVQLNWNWGFTFSRASSWDNANDSSYIIADVSIKNCSIGFDIATGQFITVLQMGCQLKPRHRGSG
jgi:glucan 1,3-beta-glucosidase